MLTLSTLIFITIVLIQEVKGANYSLNEDFNLNFDNENSRCKTKWHLINNNTLNYNFTNTDYNKIIPIYSSCASLLGRDLLPVSAIEINVYLLLTSSDNWLNVTVFDESKIPIKHYEYNRSSEIFPSELYTIKILVNGTIIGYYHFNEKGQTIELIDGNNYKQILKEAEDIQNVKKLWESDEIAKSEYLLSYNFPESDENDLLNGEGSGDNNDDGENAPTPPENVTDAPDTSPNSTIWKPWTILLVAVGSFTIISIICVSAYHIGKRRSQEDNANIIEDLEGSVNIRIPRIHSIYSGFSDRFRRHV